MLSTLAPDRRDGSEASRRGRSDRRASKRRDWRDPAAVAAARLAGLASRRFGRSATSFPGLVAEIVAPGITGRIAADLGDVILVSGTNGKTSTARFLVHILEAAERRVVANRSGANLEQAIASALVAAAAPTGRLRGERAVAVLEVDEATLPTIADMPRPRVIVLTNLFRDQLDRFGEIDALVRDWRTMLDRLPLSAVVVSNADDPRLAALVRGRSGLLEFGLDVAAEPPAVRGSSLDGSTCPRCDGLLAYRGTVNGHPVAFSCPACGFARAEPWLSVRPTGRSANRQRLAVRWPSGSDDLHVEVLFPGHGNAANAAAAIVGASVLGVEVEAAASSLATGSVPFGRFETLAVDGRQVVLSLAKNPASLDEIGRIIDGTSVDAVLFAMNDDFQDGRDVSWYWDADPGSIVRGRPYVIAGPRATDLAVRLKYEREDHRSGAVPGFLGIATSPAEGLARAIAATPPGGTCFVVATYTMLLPLRAALVDRGLAPAMPR